MNMDHFDPQNMRQFAGDCQRTSKREFAALPPPANSSRTRKDPRKGSSRPDRGNVGREARGSQNSEQLAERSGGRAGRSDSNESAVPSVSSQLTAPTAAIQLPIIQWKALPEALDITELEALKKCREATESTDPDQTYSGATEFPSLEPPVSSKALAGIQIEKINNNPMLRHKINFDPDLRLRPNMESVTGRVKAQKAEAFWCLMTVQLRDYLDNPERFQKNHSESQWTVSVTLKEIPRMLENLNFSKHEITAVKETFELLATTNVSNLGKIASWLKEMLKRKCAPIRDGMVDEMASKLADGEAQRDICLVVAGIREFLEVIEVMTLVSTIQNPLLLKDRSKQTQRIKPIIGFVAYGVLSKMIPCFLNRSSS